MSESPIGDVSDTALMVAAFRADESARSDALFRDPFAEKLAGERGKRMAALARRQFFGGYTVAVRTVIIDDFIRTALARGVDTVLNLGAGLDTRPYRMDLPGSLRWIEVDVPHIIDHKERALQGDVPRCRLSRESIDLTDRARFRDFVGRVTADCTSALVLTEGVIPYLRNEDVAVMADELARAPSVQFWVIDYFSPRALQYRRRASHRRFMQNAPFRFTPDDWFGFFAAHGWSARHVRYILEEGARLGRSLSMPRAMRLWFKIASLFMSEERRADLRRFVAYAMLERTG